MKKIITTLAIATELAVSAQIPSNGLVGNIIDIKKIVLQ